MKVVLPLVITTASLLLSGCNSDSSSGDKTEYASGKVLNEAIQGEWHSEQFVKNGMLLTYSWSFEGTDFVKKVEAQRSNGEVDTVQINGTYSSDRNVVLSSGISAKTIDLNFTDTNGNVTTVMDIVYVKDDELYFGRENISETCEGEFYEKSTLEVDIINGEVRGFEEITKCYARPVALDFERIYQSIP